MSAAELMSSRKRGALVCVCQGTPRAVSREAASWSCPGVGRVSKTRQPTGAGSPAGQTVTVHGGRQS